MKCTAIVEDAFAKLIRLRLCNKMQNNYTLLTRLFIFCCCEATSTFGVQELPSDGSRKFRSKRAVVYVSQAAALSQVVVDALKQREATALAKQRLQRQQRKCCIMIYCKTAANARDQCQGARGRSSSSSALSIAASTWTTIALLPVILAGMSMDMTVNTE
jgi:hypothetical protein